MKNKSTSDTRVEPAHDVGDRVQVGVQPVQPFERVNVGFITAVKWLMYKNLVQQVYRRWMATTFKLLLPMLSVIIVSLIKNSEISNMNDHGRREH